MSLTSKLIAKILMLCGVSLTCTACYAPGGAMYDYKMKVEGVVSDEVSGEPIEGIKVSINSTYYRAEGALTDADGKFIVIHRMPSPQKMTVTVEDTDGPENGGEYTSRSMDVELTEENFAPLDGKGGPYTDWEGHWEVDFELTLKPQENANE